MKALRTAVWAAVGLSVGLTGCDNQSDSYARTAPNQPAVSPGLLPKASPPIPDVPVPVGFKLDMKHSRDDDTGVARFVDHLYKGRTDRWKVLEFYREQMPVSRWTRVHDGLAQGRHTLEFEKGSERCVVTLRKGSLLHPTYIEVRVSTVGRIAPPSSGQKGSRGT
jgi:hypothetical protein